MDNSILVSELIELLKEYDKEARVKLTDPGSLIVETEEKNCWETLIDH